MSDLEQTITNLYIWNMKRRNDTKFVVRFTNSIRGQLRWYTNELEDEFMRKSPKSDALWLLISKHVTMLAKPANHGLAITCPDGIDEARLWFQIHNRVTCLVQYRRDLVQTEETMVSLAKELPHADWVQSAACPGFSLVNYAKLIGTVRNLDRFRSPSALWKAMGLASISKDGKTQAGSVWMRSGGLTAEDWKSIGYSPTRRSLAYLIGDGLIKAGGGVARPEKWSRYSKIYYDRKAYELQRRPDMRPQQAHRRAQRVMEKRFLRDLWVLWRESQGKRKPTTPTREKLAA